MRTIRIKRISIATHLRIMPALLFKTKPVKIATLADYLIQIRNKLNLDIKTVSMLTQIKESYIVNLEAGNYSSLPGEVYTKGFLKSLAELYHIKDSVLIQQYEKEHGFEPKEKTKPQSAKTPISLTPRGIILTSGIILALLGLIYVGIQIKSVLAAPFLQITDPASDTAVSGNSLVVAGRAEIGADVTINNQAVLTDRGGVFNESLVLSPGVNIIEIKAINKFGKESRIVRKINADIVKPPDLVEKLPVSVQLEIGPNSAWIYLEVDGAVVQRGTMLAGSSKTVFAAKEVLLTSANAGSTKVIYNGKDLGKLGREAEVIRNVEFTATPVQ